MMCPDRETLRKVLQGDADEATMAHVEGCGWCQAKLKDHTLQPNEFDRGVREAAKVPPITTEERRRAVEAVATVRPEVPAVPAAAVPTGPPPPRLGDCELLEEIGRGGMGVVHKARQLSLGGRVVAVKVLRTDKGGQEALARFRREIEAAGALEHRNVVRAYDAGEANGVPFLVMEYLSGLSVRQLVEHHGRLPIADACEIVRQTAVALDYAHARMMVHRDVKPGNLMVTVLGEVKLLDLGLVLVRTPAAADSLSADLLLLGTADYMAPEQADNAHTVDIRADLYSLGCTLYHLLAGQPPFRDLKYPDWMAKIHAHRHEMPPPVTDFRPEVPAALLAILDRLLVKDPGARFQTPADLIVALRPLTDGCNLLSLLDDGAGANDLVATLHQPAVLAPRLPAGPLDAALDVVVWDERRDCYISISEPGALPVQAGTEFYLEVRLNRPGYVYLVWISGKGEAQPLYPWQPGDWSQRPAAPVSRVRLPWPEPEKDPGTWTIQGAAGVETLLLMARDTPLPESFHAELPKRLSGLPGKAFAPLPQADRDHWFTCRDEECTSNVRAVDFGVRPMRDPVLPLHALLRDRLGTRFNLMRAVSFTNAGEGGIS